MHAGLAGNPQVAMRKRCCSQAGALDLRLKVGSGGTTERWDSLRCPLLELGFQEARLSWSFENLTWQV
jgi:hypothetical protein